MQYLAPVSSAILACLSAHVRQANRQSSDWDRTDRKHSPSVLDPSNSSPCTETTSHPLHSSRSIPRTSTYTGSHPACTMADGTAVKVNALLKTLSPGCTQVRRVPLLVPWQQLHLSSYALQGHENGASTRVERHTIPEPGTLVMQAGGNLSAHLCPVYSASAFSH
eukprot:138124-Hanusia_phi.AAC.1